MNQIKTLALLVFASSTVNAASIKLDCGRTMNVPRTVVISEKTTGNDGYTHVAIYKTSGQDQVTGMLRSVSYKMVGQKDLSTEFTGKETSVFAFVDSKNELFQLIISNPTLNKTAPIPAMEINLKTETVKKFDCFLK